MSKFILFFRGGNIPEDKKDKSIIDRLNWMDQLKGKDRFVDGSPLETEGKVIVGRTDVRTYIHNEAGVSGYVIIEVRSLDEAMEVAKSAPQASEEYGSAMVEIRQLKALINN